MPANEFVPGRPLMKSRASSRKPSTGRWVLKSTPPPNCNAPVLFEVESAKCANPPPALTNGEIPAPGRSFNFTDGVKKKVEKPSRLSSEVLNLRDGENTNGSSR